LFITLTTIRHRFETCDRTAPVNDQNRRTSLDTVDQGTESVLSFGDTIRRTRSAARPC
jgi:hypothetical protein